MVASRTSDVYQHLPPFVLDLLARWTGRTLLSVFFLHTAWVAIPWYCSWSGCIAYLSYFSTFKKEVLLNGVFSAYSHLAVVLTPSCAVLLEPRESACMQARISNLNSRIVRLRELKWWNLIEIFGCTKWSYTPMHIPKLSVGEYILAKLLKMCIVG